MSGQNHLVAALDLQPEHADDAINYLIFDGERVCDIGVHSVRVELAHALGVHQAVGDAHLIAGTLQAALQNQADTKCFARLIDAGDALGARFAWRNDLQRIVIG